MISGCNCLLESSQILWSSSRKNEADKVISLFNLCVAAVRNYYQNISKLNIPNEIKSKLLDVMNNPLYHN